MPYGSAAFWITIAGISALFGALHGYLLNNGPSAVGILYGTCIGVLTIAYERGVFFSGYSRRLRRLPTLAYFAAAEVSLLLIILAGMALTGSVVWTLGLTDKSFPEAVTPKLSTIPYALVV